MDRKILSAVGLFFASCAASMTVTQMRKTLNERCILPMAKFEQLRYTNIEYGNITCGYGLCDIRRSVEQDEFAVEIRLCF